MAGRRNEAGNVIDVENSKFYININNELGLNYKRVKGSLLALSLSKPSNYYDLRNDIINQITEHSVQETYTRFWGILRNGRINGNQTTYVDETGRAQPFVPQLPEHIINEFATKCARTIEDMCEECVDLILPDDYLKLSQNRQKDILKSKGMLEEN
jgi:hypothetical protein